MAHWLIRPFMVINHQSRGKGREYDDNTIWYEMLAGQFSNQLGISSRAEVDCRSAPDKLCRR